MKLTYRTVWISDAHLGSRGSQARDLVRFLRCIHCETLYLVGDIIDFWRLKSRWYWPAEHQEAVNLILAMARHGTRVVFIPGNHDESARQYPGLNIGGVTVLLHDIHMTIDGRPLLVTHGDQYDLVVKHNRALSMLGGAAYEWLITFNRFYNKFRMAMGKPYWSLSKAIKHRVKSACTYMSRFEESLLREARSRGVHGVVCGHIHKAEIRTDEASGLVYYNCGDWVESCTAVVEHLDGHMEVIEALPTIASLVRHRRELELASSASEIAPA